MTTARRRKLKPLGRCIFCRKFTARRIEIARCGVPPRTGHACPFCTEPNYRPRKRT